MKRANGEAKALAGLQCSQEHVILPRILFSMTQAAPDPAGRPQIMCTASVTLVPAGATSGQQARGWRVGRPSRRESGGEVAFCVLYYAAWVTGSQLALSVFGETDGDEGGGKYKYISESLNPAAWGRMAAGSRGTRGFKDPCVA
ncbi:hypothetical protein E2C01_042512 [Portunus trituberculatus]|uniref:Uncharacterized protein n=1 Tax=Portunus trituberculatus TaxID=210409 RepID=A0A5B7FTV4_PORTR|nr:hypothetical protein [Portunus trituberculatus]